MVNDLPLGAETGRKKRQTGSVESGAGRGPSGPGHLPAEALGGRLVRPLHLSSPHLLSPVCRPSRAWPQPLSSQPLAGLGEVRPAPSRAGGRVGGPASVEGQSGEPRGRGGGLVPPVTASVSPVHGWEHRLVPAAKLGSIQQCQEAWAPRPTQDLGAGGVRGGPQPPPTSQQRPQCATHASPLQAVGTSLSDQAGGAMKPRTAPRPGAPDATRGSGERGGDGSVATPAAARTGALPAPVLSCLITQRAAGRVWRSGW